MQGNLVTIAATATVAAAPSFGPAVVTLLGFDIPIMALGLSMLGLVLARKVAPPSRRKLTVTQERYLTGLLALLLFLIVTGQVGGRKLGVGMGTIWGIGLGTSGLLVIEFFGEYVMTVLYAIFNKTPPPKKDDEQ